MKAPELMTKIQATELIKTKLKPKRLAHSLAVAKAARQLALRYEGDPEKAELAGILHDIMKDYPPTEQLQWAEESAIIIDNAEKENGQLWHAPAGEAYLRLRCGIEDADLLAAVRFHTTGRAGMSKLEQILYLADIISEDRKFEGIEKIRVAAEKSLTEGVMAGLLATLQKLKNEGESIHPRSTEAYWELAGGRK